MSVNHDFSRGSLTRRRFHTLVGRYVDAFESVTSTPRLGGVSPMP